MAAKANLLYYLRCFQLSFALAFLIVICYSGVHRGWWDNVTGAIALGGLHSPRWVLIQPTALYFNDLPSHNLSHHSPHHRPRSLHPIPQQPFQHPRLHLPDIPPRHRSPHLPPLGCDCRSDAKTQGRLRRRQVCGHRWCAILPYQCYARQTVFGPAEHTMAVRPCICFCRLVSLFTI